MNLQIDTAKLTVSVNDPFQLINESKFGLERNGSVLVGKRNSIPELLALATVLGQEIDKYVNAKIVVHVRRDPRTAIADLGPRKMHVAKQTQDVISILRSLKWKYDAHQKDRIVYHARSSAADDLISALDEAGIAYKVTASEDPTANLPVDWRMTEPSSQFTEIFEKRTKDWLADDVTPHPYQLAAAQFSHAMGHRCLIADTMGLGKTIEAILCAAMLRPKLTVIICPGNVKYNWANEIHKWVNDPFVMPVEGRGALNPSAFVGITDRTFLIYSWSIIAHHADSILDAIGAVDGEVLIIADEAHKAKNPSAKRTKALRKLTRSAKYFVALTGTPVMNRPEEVWTVANMISPSDFPVQSWIQYYPRHAHKALKNIMIRRTLDDVEVQLPELTRRFITTDLEGKIAEIYHEAVRHIVEQRAESGRNIMSYLAQLTYARMAVGKAKAEAAIPIIEEIVESGESVVVFTHFKETMRRIVKRFGALKVDGSMNAIQKQKAVDAFNNGANKVIVAQITSGSAGMNLQSARHVLFVELPWTAKDVEQAEARVHRLGQSRHVISTILIVRDTIDEFMRSILERKRIVADETVDGEVTSKGFVDDVEETVIEALIQWLEGKHYGRD